MIAPNTLIGNRYRVIRPLGGGGMKHVYLAHDTRLANRPCALAEMIDSFVIPRNSRRPSPRSIARLTCSPAEERSIFRKSTTSSATEPPLPGHGIRRGRNSGDRCSSAAGGKLDESTAIDNRSQILDALEYLHARTPPGDLSRPEAFECDG